MSALWERLVETDAARDAYLGKPFEKGWPAHNWFHAIVDGVRAREEAGDDPIPALRLALLALCRHEAALTKTVTDAIAKTVTPHRLER